MSSGPTGLADAGGRSFPGFMRLRASEGSEVIADLVPEYGSPNPFMVWWDLGEGRSFVSSVVR